MLTLSHGNADPERGFSINKKLIDIHSIQIGDNTLQATRLVKGCIMRKGGFLNIQITLKLIKSVQNSHAAYVKYLKDQEREREEAAKLAAAKARAADESRNTDERRREIQEQIYTAESKLKVANNFIKESSMDQTNLSKSGNMNPAKFADITGKLQIGIKRKDKSEANIRELKKKSK